MKWYPELTLLKVGYVLEGFKSVIISQLKRRKREVEFICKSKRTRRVQIRTEKDSAVHYIGRTLPSGNVDSQITKHLLSVFITVHEPIESVLPHCIYIKFQEYLPFLSDTYTGQMET